MSNNRDDYATFDEVVDHVMIVEKCSRRTARRKVRKALSDGKLDYAFEDELLPGAAPMKMTDEESKVDALVQWMESQDIGHTEGISILTKAIVLGCVSQAKQQNKDLDFVVEAIKQAANMVYRSAEETFERARQQAARGINKQKR